MNRMLEKTRRTFHKLLLDESGQSTTEYILILAVVVMIAVKFKDKLQGVVDGATDKLKGNVDKALSG